MKTLLQKLYYAPETGFVGADKLYRKAKVINKKIKKKQAIEWYQTQTPIQQFATRNKTFPEFKITSNYPNEWQID